MRSPIAGTADESPILHIEHREIKALRKAGGVVWFDFARCAAARARRTTIWKSPAVPHGDSVRRAEDDAACRPRRAASPG
jgi:hypothetical protein